MSNPYDADDLRDALDHIMRVAKTSRSDSRRDNWIAYRAHCALTGSDDWNNEKIPKIGLLRQKIELRETLNLVSDALQRTLDFVEGRMPCLTYDEVTEQAKQALAKARGEL